MAYYDKSVNRLVSFGLSVAIHVVVLLLLVGTQLFSKESEPEAPADEPRKEETAPTEPTKADEPEKPVVKADEKPDELPPPPVAKPRPEPAKKPAKNVVKASDPEPTKKSASVQAKSEKPVREKASAAETEKTEVYVVKKGESLSSIARSRGCSFADLKRLNRAMLKKRSGLFVGDKIRVPLKSAE